ncbi:MAG: ABC-type transport auxiliary lipoprotein family protein [Thiobacillaceae bacterium]|nr:ABC-type transport auxiliary lipoprotein family protein [Thiobacillaceae bacterium]MCX7672023.1 ABC-type transport auxiliary lipoprotein family protein [Thiobacillaceae bacterium]MDW8323741.1 ABC-type transport auxiliary lipoprotein family protein [Burkholderiales bacterium]
MNGALLLGAALLLAACVRLPTPGQPITYHVLTDPGPVPASPAAHPSTLLVREMEAPALYQVTNPVFSRSAGTRAYYQYARFSEPPAKRLTWLIRQRLEAARVFRTVAPLGGSVRGDYQLNTRLIDFYHDAANVPGEALVLLEAELVRRSDARLIERRIFVARAPLDQADAQGATDALGRAANTAIDELTLWLARLMANESR